MAPAESQGFADPQATAGEHGEKGVAETRDAVTARCIE